jgi:hypothetical protein
MEIHSLNYFPIDAPAVPSEEVEAIASYCSITGSDENSARHLLEVEKTNDEYTEDIYLHSFIYIFMSLVNTCYLYTYI